MHIITACPAQKEAGAILAVQDSPDPVLADDGVLVCVAAAGVNPADLLQVAGAYPPPPGAPSWPGLEVAGLIVATGHYRNGVLLTPITGDGVAALVADGALPAELAPFPVVWHRTC